VPADLTGTIVADLVLKDGGSWSQAMPLVPPQSFTGTDATINGVLDLKYIGAMLKQLGDETGSRLNSLELIIRPIVTIAGTLGSYQITDDFSTPLIFTYTATQITPSAILAFSEPNALEDFIGYENTLLNSSLTVRGRDRSSAFSGR
jgi:hypothetical protein